MGAIHIQVELRQIKSAEEIKNLLNNRYGGFNCFGLSHDEDEYPCLYIMTKDSIASLYYIPAEREAGYISQHGLRSHEPGGTTTFYTAEGGSGATFANDSLMPFSLGVEAAIEFMSLKNLPRKVHWLAL
jgi:hypothetical protein